jgi:hypothetical protein
MTNKFQNGSKRSGGLSDRITAALEPEKTLWKRLLIATKSQKPTADPFASARMRDARPNFVFCYFSSFSLLSNLFLFIFLDPRYLTCPSFFVLTSLFTFYRLTRNEVGHPEIVPNLAKGVILANMAQ